MSLFRSAQIVVQLFLHNRWSDKQFKALHKQKLQALYQYARQNSPFYGRLYRHLPTPFNNIQDLPPVNKSLLMANFDDWVTDRAVTKAGIDEFVGDIEQVGRPYLDRYAVYTTSGTTGSPGIYLHDEGALAVYDMLWQVRGWKPWLGLWELRKVFYPDFREVFVVATGAHFGGSASYERLRRKFTWMGDRLNRLSVLLPLPELVEGLNRLQPSVLAIYPTALSLLMEEQRSGRLSIRPQLIATSGEWLAPVVREEAAAVFNCLVRDIYACSEAMYMAFSCKAGWLHLNPDWLILEPVDKDYCPVPPGQPSSTVLMTNLANRIQPLIRYDLGDSITLNPDPCPCGNSLPALRVEGRQDEILTFHTIDGSVVKVLPMSLTTVVETIPGVLRFQIIQSGPLTLEVRLELTALAERSKVWPAVESALYDYLMSQGVTGITVFESAVPPQRDPRTGKFRQVWANK